MLHNNNVIIYIIELLIEAIMTEFPRHIDTELLQQQKHKATMDINKAIKPELEFCSQWNFSIRLQQKMKLCWHFQICLPDTRHTVLRQTATQSQPWVTYCFGKISAIAVKLRISWLCRSPRLKKEALLLKPARIHPVYNSRYFTAKSNDVFWVAHSVHDAHGATGGQGQGPNVANPTSLPSPCTGKGLWLHLQTHFFCQAVECVGARSQPRFLALRAVSHGLFTQPG